MILNWDIELPEESSGIGPTSGLTFWSVLSDAQRTCGVGSESAPTNSPEDGFKSTVHELLQVSNMVAGSHFASPPTEADPVPPENKNLPRENGGEPEKKDLAKISDQHWLDFQKKVATQVDQMDLRLLFLSTKYSLEKPGLMKRQESSLKVLKNLGQTEFLLENNQQELENARKSLRTQNMLLMEEESAQQRVIEKLLQESEAIKVRRACALISSGESLNIKDGEQQLAELILRKPTLHSNPDFHDVVLNAYLEMASLRNSRGLEPWKGAHKATDFPEGKAQSAGDEKKLADPGKMFQTAADKYFEKGIASATPDFNDAIEAARRSQKSVDKNRLELFLRGLAINAEIASASCRGENTQTLFDSRFALVNEETRIALQSNELGRMATNGCVNLALAMIASGDSKLTAQARRELREILAVNPEISLNGDFRLNLARAFKGHSSNNPNSVRIIDERDPSLSIGGGGNLNVPWKELDLKTRLPELDDGFNPYLSDRLTDYSLIGLGSLAALAAVLKVRRWLRGNPDKPAGPGPSSSGPDSKPGGPDTKPLRPEPKPGGPDTKPLRPEPKPGGPDTKPLGPDSKPGGLDTKPLGPEPKPGGPDTKSLAPDTKPLGPDSTLGGLDTKPLGPDSTPGSDTKPLGPDSKSGGPGTKPPGPDSKPGGPDPKPLGPDSKPGGLDTKPLGPAVPESNVAGTGPKPSVDTARQSRIVEARNLLSIVASEMPSSEFQKMTDAEKLNLLRSSLQIAGVQESIPKGQIESMAEFVRELERSPKETQKFLDDLGRNWQANDPVKAESTAHIPGKAAVGLSPRSAEPLSTHLPDRLASAPLPTPGGAEKTESKAGSAAAGGEKGRDGKGETNSHTKGTGTQKTVGRLSAVGLLALGLSRFLGDE